MREPFIDGANELSLTQMLGQENYNESQLSFFTTRKHAISGRNKMQFFLRMLILSKCSQNVVPEWTMTDFIHLPW